MDQGAIVVNGEMTMDDFAKALNYSKQQERIEAHLREKRRIEQAKAQWCASGNIAGMEEPPKRDRGETTMHIEYINENLARLENAISETEENLRPALMQSTTQGEIPADPMPEPRTELGAHLQDINRKIYLLVSRLGEINERIDL